MKACQRNVGRLFINVHKKFKKYWKDFAPEFRIYNRKVVKKMSKYKILAITIAAVLTAFLTACGKAETDNGISPIIQTTSAETVTESVSAVSKTDNDNGISPIIQTASVETVTESTRAAPETASAAAETTLTESNELDEETAEMLRREFSEYINETDPLYTFNQSQAVIEEYYGRYSGCEVFRAFYSGGEELMDAYYVAGYEMLFPCLGYSIYVHKDGDVWELDAAYAEGIVSEEDVAKIAEKHNGVPTEKADTPSSNAASDMEWREVERSRRKELAELRMEFVEFIREAKPEYAELEPSEVGFEAYFGEFDGWQAFLPLYKMNKTGYAAMSEYITIAGYEMYFPCLEYEIYVHKDGEFYELAEAYENGYIGEDVVAAVAECNNARYFFAFQ